MAPTRRSLWNRDPVKVSDVVLTEDEKTTLLESLQPLTLSDTEKGSLCAGVGKVRGDLRADLALGLSSKGLPRKKVLRLLEKVQNFGEHIVSETKRLEALNEEVLARLERDGVWSDEDRERLLGDGHLLMAAAAKATEACRFGRAMVFEMIRRGPLRRCWGCERLRFFWGMASPTKRCGW
jgi:hypothetical protein